MDKTYAGDGQKWIGCKYPYDQDKCPSYSPLDKN